MRIALAQIDVTVGDIDGNLERCLDAVACAADADLVVLPELALTGYPPEDLLARAGFVEYAEDAVQRFAERATRPAVVGFVERGERGIHNAAALVGGGMISAIYRKRLLPNYGVFDEERYFEAGDADVIVTIAGTPCAITICEDIWHPATVERLASSGARVVLNLSASPYHRGKGGERESMLRLRAVANGVWVAYCNLVGGQDELVFDGRSMVFAPDGTLVARAEAFAEDDVCAEVGADTVRPLTGAIAAAPVAAEELYRALVLGLADYCGKNGFTDVVLGLSGGIDSALVAAVAADALGPAHVHGVLMPGPYSSAGSVDDALALAVSLGIDKRTLPIGGPLDAFLETLRPSSGDLGRTLTEENLQARVRGTLLMALSNTNGWLVLATGNKSELAVGYSTLYGDMAGGYAPIKDVFKTNVYELARWRNRDGEVIPRATIDKPPSAELRPDQTDQDSLPPYDELDAILLGYIEQDRSVDDLLASGHDAAAVERVVRMVDAAEYKRRQAAPGTRVTAKAFGRDRRMPITNAYRG
ncbi:MAG: NAD+ synthase [Coriobacteriia bacterium]|nr:NAD+ synthase [Coriobacteriia bacterium]MBN2847030.1 NAD+ synthase [Coriobacteriia bacterium]